jgi:hypothetical protein
MATAAFVITMSLSRHLIGTLYGNCWIQLKHLKAKDLIRSSHSPDEACAAPRPHGSHGPATFLYFGLHHAYPD